MVKLRDSDDQSVPVRHTVRHEQDYFPLLCLGYSRLFPFGLSRFGNYPFGMFRFGIYPFGLFYGSGSTFCFTSTEVRWLIRDGDGGGVGWWGGGGGGGRGGRFCEWLHSFILTQPTSGKQI